MRIPDVPSFAAARNQPRMPIVRTWRVIISDELARKLGKSQDAVYCTILERFLELVLIIGWL